jgi:nicotinate-nucleotide pyrophosphorylase (carboxylating)
MAQLPPVDIQAYLVEDIGSGDLTAAIIAELLRAEADVITREDVLVCGQAWFNAVFAELDPTVCIDWQVPEGEFVSANTLLCKVSGSARALLTGERTALNILQTLSATATVAKSYADVVAGTACKVLDTRKTLPGLRLAQKYAVACGGCYNHRIGLYDGVLIKENHIIAAGSIAKAVQMAKANSTVPIEVEVESLAELQQAIASQPERIMLDNFSLADLRTAVGINQQATANSGKAIELEASGNISLDTLRSIAETGVDFISIGALTKNVKAIDLSMRIQLLQA